jgi:hypothetical protein
MLRGPWRSTQKFAKFSVSATVFFADFFATVFTPKYA